MEARLVRTDDGRDLGSVRLVDRAVASALRVPSVPGGPISAVLISCHKGAPQGSRETRQPYERESEAPRARLCRNEWGELDDGARGGGNG